MRGKSNNCLTHDSYFILKQEKSQPPSLNCLATNQTQQCLSLLLLCISINYNSAARCHGQRSQKTTKIGRKYIVVKWSKAWIKGNYIQLIREEGSKLYNLKAYYSSQVQRKRRLIVERTQIQFFFLSSIGQDPYVWRVFGKKKKSRGVIGRRGWYLLFTKIET